MEQAALLHGLVLDLPPLAENADGGFRLTALEEALTGGQAADAISSVDFSALDVVNDTAFPAPFRHGMIRWLAEDALGQIL